MAGAPATKRKNHVGGSCFNVAINHSRRGNENLCHKRVDCREIITLGAATGCSACYESARTAGSTTRVMYYHTLLPRAVDTRRAPRILTDPSVDFGRATREDRFLGGQGDILFSYLGARNISSGGRRVEIIREKNISPCQPFTFLLPRGIIRTKYAMTLNSSFADFYLNNIARTPSFPDFSLSLSLSFYSRCLSRPSARSIASRR